MILPEPIIMELRSHFKKVKLLHRLDLEEGFGEVNIPPALGREYENAALETIWQQRYHVMELGLQKAVKRATRNADIDKRVTCHTATSQ